MLDQRNWRLSFFISRKETSNYPQTERKRFSICKICSPRQTLCSRGLWEIQRQQRGGGRSGRFRAAGHAQTADHGVQHDDRDAAPGMMITDSGLPL
jgi:hypothetical protein